MLIVSSANRISSLGRYLPLASLTARAQCTLDQPKRIHTESGTMNETNRNSTNHAPAGGSSYFGEREAIAEDFRFLTRLISEWHSGKNRFNAPGECLMAAYSNQYLIGIGGPSVDPFNQPNTARLRRVYVAPAARNQHVGHARVKTLVAHAALHFQKVRLSTDTSAGDAFYLRCGFMRTEDAHATHIMELFNP